MKKFKINSRQRFRAVVSDVLPYELPIIYSNKGYNAFLQRYRIRLSKEGLMASPIQEYWLQKLLEIFNGIVDDGTSLKKSYIYKVYKKQKPIEQDLKEKDGIPVLCSVKIRHRLLTIPHPYYQFRIACLYQKHADYILYLASRSNFSIRYPYKVGSFQTPVRDIQPNSIKRQEHLDEEESLKHYFAYKRYQNINGFYNDYKFQHAEKKFKFLIRTDIEKCFDNIAAEKLFLAIYDVESINQTNGFADEFVRLQKEMFSGKLIDFEEKEIVLTDFEKGIPIGPEFSRIFAELILQSVDRLLEKQLLDAGKYIGKDYEFYRYVDDGFFFCNDINLAQTFLHLYKSILKQWGMDINSKKVKPYYERPFLDDLTIAKRKLISLVDSMFYNRLETVQGIINMSNERYDVPFTMESKYIIRDLQSIVKEYNCQYVDITASLLSQIHSKLGKFVFSAFTKIYRDYFAAHETDNIDSKGQSIYKRYEEGFIDFCKELTSFLFFIFASDMRMSTSVKVMQILIDLLDYVDGRMDVNPSFISVRHFTPTQSYQLKKHITDELRGLLVADSRLGIEKANLLLLYHRMPRTLLLSSEKIETLFQADFQMDFLTLFTLEHLVGRRYKDSHLQQSIMKWIVDRLSILTESNSAEFIYILVNSLNCPYFDRSFKRKICRIVGLRNCRDLVERASKYENIFVDWRSNKLLTMLKEKANTTVY